MVPHFNPEQYKDPLAFIPERYDPESEYFCRQNCNKSRDVNSWLPFSRGTRTCPGQTLAFLELRLLISYFLSKFEYDVDQQQIEKEYVGFGAGSHHQLDVIITKIHG
jgi:cytochrome P450